MSKKPKINVSALVDNEVKVHTFRDWWDFADWCKQLNLQAKSVTILLWEYEK